MTTTTTTFQMFSTSSDGRFMDACHEARERTTAGGMSEDEFAFGDFDTDEETGRTFCSFSTPFQSTAERFAQFVEFFGAEGVERMPESM